MKKIWLNDGQFKKLNHEELKGLNEEEKGEYQKDLYGHLEAEKSALEGKIASLEEKGEGNEKEIAKMRGELVKIDLDSFKQTQKEHGVLLKRLSSGISEAPKSVKSQIVAWVKDNSKKIKELKSAGHGVIQMTVKAPESIYTGSATNPDGIPELVGVQSAAPSNVNLKGTVYESLVTTFPTSLAAYPYTETVPKDGDYAFVAEKGTKPQIDFKIETRYAEPVKCAAHEVLTDESIQDIPNLQSIAQDFLRKKHDLKKQNGILFGDGVSPNPKGATTYGRSFVAGDMADKVASANFMDVVNAAITDIYTTHNYQDEMPYMANIVLVNPIDFYLELVSAKDDNGLPLYPTASLFNQVTLGGATIIPFEDIPVGKIFVCDMSKYNVTNYVDYTVKIGWINDQMITNEFTMVGESRFHAFVKKLDEQAFIYDDIAVIKAAIDPAVS